MDRRLIVFFALALLVFGCVHYPPSGRAGTSLTTAAFGLPPPEGATCGGNATGDWIVAGDEECSNGVIILDGNLTIQSGGNLNPAQRNLVH